MSELKFPTEQVELPSKGLVYPKDNPLSSGTVEMRYMTAKEEDILTNQNYIKDGTVIDRLLKALIVTKINYDDLVVGDKNAIMISARVLGYGKDYTFKYNDEEITVDLSELNQRFINEDELLEKNINQFTFTLPHSEIPITFKLLSNKDDKAIKAEVAGLKKIDTVVGQSIVAGEPIGKLHKSGRSHKPVLYYELRFKGNAVNPAKKFAELS